MVCWIWAAVVVTAMALSCLGSAPSVDAAAFGPPTVLVPTWVPNGNVDALTSSGDTIYVGGDFSRWTTPTGAAAVVDRDAGGVDGRWWPVFAGGRVVAAVADGHGGWYVGGDFSVVGGEERAGLVHLRANHTLDRGWDPPRLGAISALFVAEGRVYVSGGSAVTVPAVRPYVVALDRERGRILPWRTSVNGPVDAMLKAGSTVYLGGDFTRIGGKQRAGVAAVDVATATVLPWNPKPQIAPCLGQGLCPYPNTVEISSLALAGSTLFLGGFFDHVGGVRRDLAAAVNLKTGRLLAWNPRLSPNSGENRVSAIVTAGSRVVIAGSFTRASGRSRNGLVIVDSLRGQPTRWTTGVRPPRSVDALVALGRTVYVGGTFDRIAGARRRNAAAIDVRQGRVTRWNPDPAGRVLSLAVTRNSVFLGGEFGGVKGVARNGLAALNAETGELLSWSAKVDGEVQALAIDGKRLYVGGRFTQVDGRRRLQLASFDLASGALTDWSPTATRALFGVLALAVADGTVFVGGEFPKVNGETKGTNFAALDALSGALRPWSVRADDSVYALAVGEGYVYAAGPFTRIGTARRAHLAKIDPADGRITDWSPRIDPCDPATVTVAGSTVYVGGCDAYLAALDANTGAKKAWAPQPERDSFIQRVAERDGTVFVGGDFHALNATPQNAIAAVDAVSGNLLSWDPHVSGFAPVSGYDLPSVDAIAFVGPFTALGGNFMGIMGAPRLGFALLR
jgi:hypothetical protein